MANNLREKKLATIGTTPVTGKKLNWFQASKKLQASTKFNFVDEPLAYFFCLKGH